MCDCIKNFEKEMKKAHYPDAESISIDNVELLSGKLYSTASVKLPNRKKPEKINILHTYCPMCGKKYPDKNKEDCHE